MRRDFQWKFRALANRLWTRFVDRLALAECPGWCKKLPPSKVHYSLTTTSGTKIKVCRDCYEDLHRPFKYRKKEST